MVAYYHFGGDPLSYWGNSRYLLLFRGGAYYTLGEIMGIIITWGGTHYSVGGILDVHYSYY